MAKYTIKTPTARLEIDADALSKVLIDTCGPGIDAFAASGAAVAQGRVSPSAKPFIRSKSYAEKGRRHLRSGKLSPLARLLTVPVALVVNDSWFAEGMEWGSSRKHPQRPLSSAFEALAAQASRAERGRSG